MFHVKTKKKRLKSMVNKENKKYLVLEYSRGKEEKFKEEEIKYKIVEVIELKE